MHMFCNKIQRPQILQDNVNTQNKHGAKKDARTHQQAEGSTLKYLTLLLKNQKKPQTNCILKA